MSKTIPTVQAYMTYTPHTIGSDQTLKKATDMMKEYKIRHLPVLKGGKLMGILTDRDVKLVSSFKDVSPETLTVDEACSYDPYFTTPNALLSDVVTVMAEKKYGSALVVDNNKLVGIFTEVDAYKALAKLLETRLK